ncbi:MAG: sigma-54-dependent Fis family transcriptional regulator [Candidatus Fermentibacteraceae bacterium]|nr:sigma-54-dependent Fis family transcriptional regulator [Candidatus Fermentibacteraceae bacterium]MBN2608156.1 sigma-54-dependent Fis family transcriptional regulator [Candidatus Fermentibacteraceae bacterium]
MITALGRGTVLVTDEDPQRGQELKNAISSMGYSATVLPSARNTIRRIRKRSVNAVMISSTVEDMHISAFLETLRKANLAAGIVIYGRNINAEDAISWMKSGAADIILNTDDLEEMKSAIQRAFSFSIRTHERKLSSQVSTGEEAPQLLYRSRAMGEVVSRARRVAPLKATVLITGESGTGKDVLAKQIHAMSGRTGSFMALNCAAIPHSLLEDELFGHERGAYTGAESSREGKFEAATHGTLLLDEIGEIPPDIQVKLLRILEENVVTRLGGNQPRPVDVRLIAATNSDLRSAVKRGSFREDLYYRLKVVEIQLPPLRARKTDIPMLAMSFLREAAERHNLPMPELAQDALEHLVSYNWPGNVRQLRNLMESLLIIAGSVIGNEDLPEEIAELPSGTGAELRADLPVTLDKLEEQAIRKTLDMTGGNRTRAAELLGIGRRTLQRKLKEM